MITLKKIGLDGSCHWCTEAIFQSLKGVLHVSQGWIASENKTRVDDGKTSAKCTPRENGSGGCTFY